MEFLIKCACVLLVTSCIGVNAALGCEMDEITACGKPLVAMTDAEKTNLNLVCQISTDASKCFRDVAETCSPEVNATLQVAWNESTRIIAECHGFVPNTTCTIVRIQGCAAPLTNMTLAEKTSLDFLCPTLQKSVNCLKVELATCPYVIREKFDPQNTELQTAMNECAPYLNQKDCDLSAISKCLQPLVWTPASDQEDLSQMCGTLKTSVVCLSDVLQKCPNFNQTIYPTIRDQLTESLLLCDNQFNGTVTPTCSMEAIRTCGHPTRNMTDEERNDPVINCRKNVPVAECELTEMDRCHNSLKSQLTLSKARLELLLDKCRGILNSSANTTPDPGSNGANTTPDPGSNGAINTTDPGSNGAILTTDPGSNGATPTKDPNAAKTGFECNHMMTLVAAMLVTLRHFL